MVGYILLVDDDPAIRTTIKEKLELDGYIVTTASTGLDALKWFEEIGPALILMDISLRDIDGIQFCRLIRARSNIPIIILTARDSISDKVLGLESGAHDYMVKPVDYLELAARIKICLKRVEILTSHSTVLELGSLKIDTNKIRVLLGGRKIDLTQREFNLLLLLAINAGRALSRKEIRRAIWPQGGIYENSRAIDVHIQHLRSKLEDNSANPEYIVTLPGLGYMFSSPKKMSDQ